jgi:hypothetical protein
MARTSTLRASDADRDAVAERLRQAAVEGRLEPWELEQRLHTALRARTYGELDPLLRDLPQRSVTRRRPPLSPGPSAGLVALVAVRLVVTLLIVAALMFAFAVTAAWWLLGLIVWVTIRSTRRSCSGWHRPPPRARRVY